MLRKPLTLVKIILIMITTEQNHTRSSTSILVFMTKTNTFLIIISVSLIAYGVVSYLKDIAPKEIVPETAGKLFKTIHLKDGREVINVPPGKNPSEIINIKIKNKISNTWNEKLEDSLKTQGGESIKEITITKIKPVVLY